jgi:hypothetical protein
LINGVVLTVNAEIVQIPAVLASQLLPTIESKTIYLIQYIEDLLESTLTCKEISQDLYGMGNSFCTVATRGMDARWLSSIVLALTFLLSIPVWICAANSFYDPEQREREQQESDARPSKGRKSTGKRESRAGTGIAKSAAY